MKSWMRILGPLLEIEKVREALGLRSQRDVRTLSTKGQLLTLDSPEGQELYPLFQFAENGNVRPEIARLLKIFSSAVNTPYTIASWFVSPQDLLEQETPAAWLRSGRDPELVFEAARRAAAKLAH